jgi:hypothetical protein
LLPRVSVKTAVRRMIDAARLGGACLGLALIASSPTPETFLAAIAVVFLILGGVTWTLGRRCVLAVRIVAMVFAVALARLAGGPMAAVFAVALLALGAWLRIHAHEAVSGVAVFGYAVALAGHASLRIIAVFWMLGVTLLLLRSRAKIIWRWFFRRVSPTDETRMAEHLDSDRVK